MAKVKYKYYECEKVSSFAEMLDNAMKTVPYDIAYKYKKDDGVFSLTFSSFIKRVYSLGAFLTEKGFKSSHIACIGANSINWLTAFFAVLRSSGVFVPVDKELPQADILNVINDSESEVIFTDGKYEDFLLESCECMPNVKMIICFDREKDGNNSFSFRNVLTCGKKLDKIEYLACKSDPDELKLLVYTSGTTGISKGVMLSERNLLAIACNGPIVTEVLKNGLSLLPYNHTYECVADIIVSFHCHSSICINDSLIALVKNFKLFKPDYTYVVPAIAEMLYTRINREIEAKGAKEKFDSLVAMSNNMRKIGIDRRRELFASILDTFGGELKKITCGGAPLRAEVAEFFENIGITFINGYGITECSPLVCVNNDEHNDYHTAGIKLPCIEWKINEPNSEGIGEILVKGDSVMLGYYKRPDLTAEVLRDGWFYTGDYGMIDETDKLIISGRKKNIIVLNNGKNIYPEEIEGYIQGIDYVNEVIVSGEIDENGNESSLSAEVFLSEVRTPSEVLRSIKDACKELPIYKQISKVVIRDKEFEKTSTNKIKRVKKK